VDIDPQAVEIAMMSLYLKCLEGEKDLPRKKELLPSLAKNIRCGNSLISYDIFDQLTLFDEEEKERINPFDWHSKSTGFGEIMKKGGFDVVIGNPPYIQLSMAEYFNNTVKKYLLSHFCSSMGRLNTFGFFIEKGIDLLESHGLFGYIVPNTMVSQEYYQVLRKFILKNTKINGISIYEESLFKEAVVENVTVILEKEKDNSKRMKNKIIIERFFNEKSISHSLPQKLLEYTYKNIFPTSLTQNFLSLYEKMTINKLLLNEIVNINQAIALKQDKAKSIFLYPKNNNFKKLLDGRNINRYLINWPGNYLLYNKRRIHSCKREDIFLAQEKILFRRVGRNIIATYDNEKYYALNTLVVITLKPEITFSLKYILAILNSKLISFYFVKFLKSSKKIFSEIQARKFSQLPIHTIDFNKPEEKSMHDKMVDLVNKMLELNKKKAALPPSSKRDKIEREIQITDEKIDELVYELYGITENDRKIIEGEI